MDSTSSQKNQCDSIVRVPREEDETGGEEIWGVLVLYLSPFIFLTAFLIIRYLG